MNIDYQNEFNQYLSAIESNDTNTLLRFKDNQNIYLYKNFSKEFNQLSNFANCTANTLNVLIVISPDSEVPKTLYNSHNFLSIKDYILKRLLENLPSVLRFEKFNCDIFSWINDKNESILNPSYSFEIIKNFLEEDISEKQFISTHKIILKNYPTLIMPMFEAANNEKNWQFFLNSPLYSSFVIDFLEKHNNAENTQQLMSNSFKNGNKFHIERLYNLDVAFPTDNSSYSILFATIRNKDAIEFVAKNIEDIAFSNHIILRTLFSSHSNSELRELGSIILDKYNISQLDNLIKFCEKKPKSGVAKEENLILIKHYYLEAQIPQKYNSKKKSKI